MTTHPSDIPTDLMNDCDLCGDECPDGCALDGQRVPAAPPSGPAALDEPGTGRTYHEVYESGQPISADEITEWLRDAEEYAPRLFRTDPVEFGSLARFLRAGAKIVRQCATPAPSSEPVGEPLHEWRCPGCDTVTRARMADQEPAGPVLGDDSLTEQIAAKVHEAWIETKRAQGITSRPSEWGEEQMVPYADLSERAKDTDRGTVRAVLDAVGALNVISALDGRARDVGLSPVADAAFPGLPAGMTQGEIERRMRAGLDVLAPHVAALVTAAARREQQFKRERVGTWLPQDGPR